MPIRNNFIIISLLALLFSACSDSKQEKTQDALPTKTASSADISISDNANAYESKVQSADDVEDRSYYYSYNQRKQKPHDVRTPYTANMHVRSPYEEVRINLLVKKLSKKFILKCSPCHNDYANGLIGPSLLHKDADFIYDTIMKFKSGEKTNALMVQMVKMMDNKEIKELSIEIENFNKEIQNSGDK